MVRTVNRRLFRTLIYVLVTAQIFLSAPVVSAMAGAATPSPSEMPCADSMPHASDADACPCCAEGDLGTAGCLSACTASVGAISTFELPAVSLAATPLPALPSVHIARASDPPLKPPPIF